MLISSETVIKLWNEWEIRALLLLSLLFQVTLIAFGSRRKRSANIVIRIVVWSAYMSADWVATVALGILARNLGGDSGSETPNSLPLFWTPFLILHLGGPDNITAYSLEDNELWPRHFLGLLVQMGVAFYVFWKSWSDNALTFIAIPVYIAGIIKYGERTWVLRSSSSKHFKSSLLSAPDAGPDYAKFVRGRYNLQLFAKIELDDKPVAQTVLQSEDVSSDDYLGQAAYLFKRFKYLFADLILGYYERTDCYSIIRNKSSEEAFKLVEIELAFLYDLLYTKAKIVYSCFGIFLRCISFLASASAFVTFSIFFFDKHDAYSPADFSITYVLLVGAVALEVYAIIILVYSDWTKPWLVKNKFKKGPSKQDMKYKRWSGKIAGYNLMNVCLKEATAPRWIRVQKLFGLYKILNRTSERVDELQELIFQQLTQKSESIKDGSYNVNLCKTLLAHRGDNALKEIKCDTDPNWSTDCTVGVAFDHSLLLWHIATDLCYYDDVWRFGPDSVNEYSKISKFLSDYMLYLLVMCPDMLPKGIGEIRYRDTCSEAIRFFEQSSKEIKKKVGKACNVLFHIDTEMQLEEIKGDRCKSVLFHGSRLAKKLQSLWPQGQADQGCKEKWETINKVWVELLAYAAVHCGWKEHAQQLKGGGEFLTHVCLLMAHLGLTEQYQIQKQFIYRPKLWFRGRFLDEEEEQRSVCKCLWWWSTLDPCYPC